jgi:hypothetical protein
VSTLPFAFSDGDGVCQGIAEHDLEPAEKQVFFVTLRRLAGRYGRLPDSIIITERIEVEDKILASGGFADVRCGRCMGHLVAVKTLRVAKKDDLLKIRKVSVNNAIFASHLGRGLNYPSSSNFAKKSFSGAR